MIIRTKNKIHELTEQEKVKLAKKIQKKFIKLLKLDGFMKFKDLLDKNTYLDSNDTMTINYDLMFSVSLILLLLDD